MHYRGCSKAPPSATRPQGFGGAVHYAELQLAMQARHNSSACLHDGTCLPLGGHSVWAAQPPLPPPAAADAAEGPKQEAAVRLPVTLVLASVDTSGMFHDSLVVRTL